MGNIPSNQAAPLLLEEKTASQCGSYLAHRAKSNALCFAAKTKNLAQLNRLISLKNGEDIISKRDPEGFSAIHYTVFSQWPEGLKTIIEAKADVNARSNQGYSPLQLAAYLGDVKCIEILLDAGANIEQRAARNTTALILAAQQGAASKDALSLLLSRGASVLPRGFRNRTALQVAVYAHGREEVIKMLTDAGADPSIGNPEMHNNTPLHTAAHLQRYGAMRALLAAGGNPNKLSDLGLTPLMEVFLADVVQGESIKRCMLRELSQAGANLNTVVPNKGLTALHFAVLHSQNEFTVESLLALGIDATIGIDLYPSPSSRNTMLHTAAKRSWVNVLNILLEAGADWRLRNKEGLTALHVAVITRKPAAVKALLAHGVDPYQLGPDIRPGYSQWKVQRGVRAMQALMNGPIPLAGAEELLQRINGSEEQCSAVDLACCVMQDIEIVEAFLEAGAKPSPEALALAEQCVPIMRVIVERPIWTPEFHKKLPAAFKQRAQLLLWCLKRASTRRRNPLPALTDDALACVLTSMMYPVSQWANPVWVMRQKLKEATSVVRENNDATTQNNNNDNNANGQDNLNNINELAGGQVPQTMQIMPDIMEQVLQHIQQEMAAGMEAGELMAHVPLPQLAPNGGVELQEGAVAAQILPPGVGENGQQGVAMVQFQLHPPVGAPVVFPPFLAGMLPAALAAAMPHGNFFPDLEDDSDEEEEEEEELEEEDDGGEGMGNNFLEFMFQNMLNPQMQAEVQQQAAAANAVFGGAMGLNANNHPNLHALAALAPHINNNNNNNNNNLGNAIPPMQPAPQPQPEQHQAVAPPPPPPPAAGNGNDQRTTRRRTRATATAAPNEDEAGPSTSGMINTTSNNDEAGPSRRYHTRSVRDNASGSSGRGKEARGSQQKRARR